MRRLKMLKHCSKCRSEFWTLLRFRDVGYHVCPNCKTKGK